MYYISALRLGICWNFAAHSLAENRPSTISREIQGVRVGACDVRV